MNSHIATIAYVLLILGLFALDRDRSVRTSAVLWLPTLWLAICASRMVSQWFGVDSSSDSADQYLEGSPLDRFLLAVLILVGIGVLVKRREKVTAILRANGPILLFFLYCSISIAWSDYPGVAFKRWVKALGALTMVLIVLTEVNPSAAVKRWLSQVGFVLVPMSILLIKYYPDLGRGYNRFTWSPFYRGVTTGKNELGIVCLIFGIGAVWRLLQMRSAKRSAGRTRQLVVQVVFLAMIFWLFWMANSMTSLLCFLMAVILLVSTSFRRVVRSLWVVHVLVALMLAASFSTLFLGMGSDFVKTVGRDPTLTGRTEVWTSVLALEGNPWFGTGFESFWLGPRIEKLWDIFWWHPNEAHSGYIEVFLNLGWVGIVLFSLILVTGYRKAISAVRRSPEEGQLRLAFLFTALVYNCTESASGAMHPVWIFLLLAAMNVPGGWNRIKNVSTKTAAIPTLTSEETGTPVLEEG
jgi:exopolysaccharide production protein ExoQ